MTAQRAPTAKSTSEGIAPGELMRLVTNRLKAHGFRVQLPEWTDERWISVERWGGCCELSVDDSGFVEWECVPWGGDKTNPKPAADISTFLLTGRTGNYPCERDWRNTRGMTYMGTVGQELRTRGFDVCLEVHEDNDYLEVFARILVTNPVTRPNAKVRISDDGSVEWQCGYRCELTATTDTSGYLDMLTHLRELANSIAATVAHAIALASGVVSGEC
jgi:hypothetical protein